MTNGKTILEQSIETEHDSNELRYIWDVNDEQESHPRSVSDDMMDVEDKENMRYKSYLKKLKTLWRK